MRTAPEYYPACFKRHIRIRTFSSYLDLERENGSHPSGSHLDSSGAVPIPSEARISKRIFRKSCASSITCRLAAANMASEAQIDLEAALVDEESRGSPNPPKRKFKIIALAVKALQKWKSEWGGKGLREWGRGSYR